MELASKFNAKKIEAQIKEYTKSLDLEKMIFEFDSLKDHLP